jgi:hypothetical protein
MVLIAIGLLIFFYRKGWLFTGGDAGPSLIHKAGLPGEHEHIQKN